MLLITSLRSTCVALAQGLGGQSSRGCGTRRGEAGVRDGGCCEGRWRDGTCQAEGYRGERMKDEGIGVQEQGMQGRTSCARVNGIWRSPLCPPQPPALPALGLGRCSHRAPCAHPRGYSATARLEQEQWAGARTSCCAHPGVAMPGGHQPQPWWPRRAVGAQRLPATLAAGAEQFRSLPRSRPCQVDSRGHILARAPCQPWPLPTACPVQHHLPSPHCCYPAVATSVPPARAAPDSGDVGVGSLHPLDPGQSQVRAPPRLGHTGWLGQESLQKAAQEGPSCLSELAGVWHRAWHRALWHSRVRVSAMAQHTAAGTGPLSPAPRCPLAPAESMTREGFSAKSAAERPRLERSRRCQPRAQHGEGWKEPCQPQCHPGVLPAPLPASAPALRHARGS